jgi:hypothetical protein
MVTHYESLQGGPFNDTSFGIIFLALVQWPFRHLLYDVAVVSRLVRYKDKVLYHLECTVTMLRPSL